ncbi:MAG: ferredoxin [Acidimicrobiales bacterium]
MELEIGVNRGRCMGSGQCVHWAPGVFAQDEEAIFVVVDSLTRGEVVDDVNCRPTEAISLWIDGIEVDAHFLKADTAVPSSMHPLCRWSGPQR